MNETKISDLLNKVEDKLKLTNLFEDIINFIKDVKPALDNIHNEINANIEKIPAATKKISKVTEATELATTEMLNILDSVFVKVDTITKELETMTNNFNNASKLFVEVLESIKDGITNDADLKDVLPKINDVIHIITNYQDDNNQQRIIAELQSINNDATAIMMTLQIQDITSQQLAAVKYLIDNMQMRLQSIIEKVDNSEFKELLTDTTKNSNVTELHRKIAFDPDAMDSIDYNLNRQQMVDEVFSYGKNDDFFSSKSNNSEEVDDNLKNNENSNDSNNEQINSTNENNKDFENNSLLDDINGNVSQDDIDKIFGD